jgi:hypothetical protein
MTEQEYRSARVTAMVTPDVERRLIAYARRHRWSKSAAAAVLIEAGLVEQEEADMHSETEEGEA